MQKLVEWSEEKNQLLKRTRNVCFEDVENAILNDEFLDVLPHPNQGKFGHQRIFVLRLSGYVHFVPFVEDDDRIFLKTIIPSRNYKKQYD